MISGGRFLVNTIMKAIHCITNKEILVCPSILNSYVDAEGIKYQQGELDFQSLSLFTDEELRKELERREDQKDLEAGVIRRCRNCVHCAVKPERGYGHICMVRTYGKNNKNYTVNLSNKACELFEPYV